MFAKRNFSFIFLSLDFSRDFVLKLEASVRFRFLSEQSVLFFFPSVEDDFVSQLCLSCVVFLSDLRKKVRQDLVVLCAG